MILLTRTGICCHRPTRPAPLHHAITPATSPPPPLHAPLLSLPGPPHLPPQVKRDASAIALIAALITAYLLLGVCFCVHVSNAEACLCAQECVCVRRSVCAVKVLYVEVYLCA